jgi:hypothetical protein
MYLFFDTETADKPRSWKAPASDLDNWPRLVQIGWISCDRTGRATGPCEEAHSALADAEACMRCFFELKEIGVIR